MNNNKKLKIGIVSKLWESTSPYSTGGTGVLVGMLVNGLVEKGHQVTLFASGDSKTKAQKLIAVKNKPYKNDYSEIKEYQNIFNAFKMSNQFDIIHTHVEHKACFFVPLVQTPTLINIEYGEFFEDELKLLKNNKNLNYCFNSQALQKKLNFLKCIGVAYSGLDLKLYPFNPNPKKYLLFLGRVSPQKGIHLAIQAAIKNDLPLIIAGKLSNVDKKYLDKNFWPSVITKKNIKYLGEVKFKQKIQLLKNAMALIQPTKFFEACSATILEAQACGTPVITTDQGSNKKLIKQNITGLLVTPQNIISKIKNIEKINRFACRKWIEKNFTAEKMTDEYEKLYYQLLK